MGRDKSLIKYPENYVVLDIETTGFSAENDEIIELSALRVVDNEIVEEFSELVNPQRYVSSYITNLTGITPQMLENAEKMRSRVSSFGPTLILPVTVNAKTLYRVRLGPESAKKALEIMDKVTGSGISDARLVEEKGTLPAGKRLDSAF